MQKYILFIICLFWQSALAQSPQQAAAILFENAASSPSVPGVSVAVADENGVSWAQGFGYSDLENKTPMTASTKMRIGSVAKVITTAALMKLYEKNQIGLDTPVRNYVPEWPAKHPPITIRNLTMHTSGIRHYKDDEFLSNVQYDSTIDGLDIFKDDDLLFAPGSQYSYSTYAWTLIAAAMEKVDDNRLFKQIILDEVITPLALTGMTFDDNEPLIDHRQRSYTYTNGVLLNSPEVNSSYKYAGGGFLSTPTAVVKFAMAHATAGFLKQETLDTMFAEPFLENGTRNIHGIGWRIGFTKPTEEQLKDPATAEMQKILAKHPHIVHHSGGSVGGITQMLLCLDHNRAVTVVKNVDGEDSANVLLLALQTLDIFYEN